MDLNTILHVRGTETLEFRLSYAANNNRVVANLLL